jgi:hypothetical protein
MLATHTRPLKLLALAVALAGLGVPTAQAKFDPWAHNLVPQSTQSVPFITEHSAGQNGTGQRSTAQSVPLITDNSSAALRYAYDVGGQIIMPPADNTSDSTTAAGQRAEKLRWQGLAKVYTALQSSSAGTSTGFHWRDAGTGAGVAFAAVLLAVGVATLIMRRGRRRLAGF